MTSAVELTPAGESDAIAVLHRVGAGNPLLRIAVGDDLDMPAAAWRATDTGTHAADRLIEAVGAWAGTSERRVAGSLVVLGYSARLLGPTLATLIAGGLLLDARPARTRYAYGPQTGFRLALRDLTGWRGPAEQLRRRWCGTVLDEHLGGLIAAVQRAAPAAAGMLWGNVASGIAGALRALVQADLATVEVCHDIGLALLDHGALRGTGILTVHSGQLQFRRRSCCLYYRLDGGGLCGDCPLLKT